MKKPISSADAVKPVWGNLYRVGGLAGLIAGILFRRNLAVEISLFNPLGPPENLADLYALLQSNRLLGLAYLHVFDIVNYLLVGVMFLALYVLLRREKPSAMILAVSAGMIGIVIYASTNTALSLLSLSDVYAAAATDRQKVVLENAGQALLVFSRFSSSGASPGAGGFLSLLLIALASLVISLVMLRSALFHRVTAIVGILASSLDLGYCFAFLFLPTLDKELLAVTFIPAAGLLIMIWHILTGIRLYQLGRDADRMTASEGRMVRTGSI